MLFALLCLVVVFVVFVFILSFALTVWFDVLVLSGLFGLLCFLWLRCLWVLLIALLCCYRCGSSVGFLLVSVRFCLVALRLRLSLFAICYLLLFSFVVFVFAVLMFGWVVHACLVCLFWC